MQESWVQPLGQVGPLDKEMAPTPVFLPRELHRQRSLVIYSPWGHKVLDTTERQTHSVFLPLLINISVPVRSIPFLSFIVPIFALNVALLSLIFLKRSLVYSSISFHWLLRKPFLSLLAVLLKSVFRWLYLSFSPLPFASLFSAICKPSSDNHFAFLHFFFVGMVLVTASCCCCYC